MNMAPRLTSYYAHNTEVHRARTVALRDPVENAFMSIMALPVSGRLALCARFNDFMEKGGSKQRLLLTTERHE